MKISKLLLALTCCSLPILSQANGIWSEPVVQERSLSSNTTSVGKTYQLNFDALIERMNMAGEEGDSATVMFPLPMPNGDIVELPLIKTNVIPPALASKFDRFNSFKVEGQDYYGHLDLTSRGFHGFIFTPDGAVMIDPEEDHYVSYMVKDRKEPECLSEDWGCGFEEEEHHHIINPLTEVEPDSGFQLARKTGGELLEYRIAIAATGEYTRHFGSKQDALAAIATTVNRVSMLTQRDLSIRLRLVDNNDLIVYDNPNTDPYTNSSNSTMLGENQSNLSNVLGLDNFDVGHVFGTSGGGVAYVGVVCNEGYKAQGVSGSRRPSGDSFDVGIFAHELGHQLGASHSYNGTAGACAGQRSADGAVEPGSGSSIMSYSGSCGSENLQWGSDAVYHADSIEQIFNTRQSRWYRNCEQTISTGNQVPNVDGGDDFVIPASTPFILTASADDLDADLLTFTWDQMDAGNASSANDMADDGTRAIFRSFEPTTEPYRYFPRLSDIRNNTQTIGEWLPTTNRDLNFTVTVRDQEGGVNEDQVTLTVNASAGPFRVTRPNSGGEFGSSLRVTWDVANTDLAPINCEQVNIELSLDDGETFNTVLLENTPNDGAQRVDLPRGQRTNARIRVMCADNVFFDMSDQAFSFNSTFSGNTPPQANDDEFSVMVNSAVTVLNVLENDTDEDQGDSLSVIRVATPNQGGTAEVVNGQLRYQPAVSFTGSETFRYTIADDEGSTAQALVTINVVPPANVLPMADNDSYTVMQDITAEPVTQVFNVLMNDSDLDSDLPLTIVEFTQGSAGGKVELSSNQSGNQIYYTPVQAYVGQESFTYTIEDAQGGRASAEVTVEVQELDLGPVATDDVYELEASLSAWNLNVLENDTSDTELRIVEAFDVPDSLTVSVILVDRRPHLLVTRSEPVAEAQFSYRISDADQMQDAAEVTLTFINNDTDTDTDSGSDIGSDTDTNADTSTDTSDGDAPGSGDVDGDDATDIVTGSFSWTFLIFLLLLFRRTR